MTFLEKLKEDNEIRMDEIGCPSNYDYEGPRGKECDGKCVDCWNREMPGTDKPTVWNGEKELNIDKKKREQKEDYEQGLNDAWELFKKVLEMPGDIIREHILEGDSLNPILSMVNCLTPQEALAKLKAYEEQMVKIGDIVIPNNYSHNPREVLVLDITPNGAYKGIWLDTFKPTDAFSMVTKTGKHIDIQRILSQIGGE